MSTEKNLVSNLLGVGVKPKIVYNSAKLTQYFNVKDAVPYKSNLVYKCACPRIDCKESCIGEIEKRIEEHSIDHEK